MTALITALAFLVVAAEDRGVEIARAADKADSGWGAEQATVTMSVDVGGATEERTLRLTLLDTDPERSLVEILEPARHRGMKVLTLAEKNGEDQVFVYFPRHGKTQRIVGRKRSGRFLGSELTYEDLGSRKYDRYDHHFLREDAIGAVRCTVVEAVPRDPDSAYAKIVLWREIGTYRLLRIEWFDRSGGALSKTGTFTEWTVVGGFHRPGRYEVVSQETGRKTTLVFGGRQVKLDVPTGMFSPERLGP